MKIRDIVQGKASVWQVGPRFVALSPSLQTKSVCHSGIGLVCLSWSMVRLRSLLVIWQLGQLHIFFSQIILCNNYNVNGTICYGWVKICQFENKRLGFISTFAFQHQSVNLSHTIISLKPSFNCKLMYSYLLRESFTYSLNNFNTNFQLIWFK